LSRYSTFEDGAHPRDDIGGDLLNTADLHTRQLLSERSRTDEILELGTILLADVRVVGTLDDGDPVGVARKTATYALSDPEVE
jgi:hypothetical protein